ncbi:MAG: hypothetical protein ACTSR8_00545 [Promethearchaeota archaeon]
MVQINIICPACSKRGYIEIDEKVINQSSRGVTAINIAAEQICSHSFVAYIDKNLAVRDCFITDFQIVLPQMDIEQKIVEKEIPGLDIIDVDLIKINIPAMALTNMLRAYLFKKPVLFLFDDEFLHRHLENFFKFISQDNFEYELLIGEHDLYKKSKKHFKSYIVLDKHNVINDKQKLLDPKKIKIERTIVQKFLAEYDPKSSLIIIKNEIQRSFELAKSIMEIIENHEGEEKLGKKKLIDKLNEKINIKIPFSYLEFLLNILKNYYQYNLSVLSDYYFPAFGI